MPDAFSVTIDTVVNNYGRPM